MECSYEYLLCIWFFVGTAQMALQLYICLISRTIQDNPLGLTIYDLYSSIFASFLHICLTIFILNIEAANNGMNFQAYAIVAMQGRFGFTPYLHRIATGSIQHLNYDNVILSHQSIKQLESAMSSNKANIQSVSITPQSVGQLALMPVIKLGKLFQSFHISVNADTTNHKYSLQYYISKLFLETCHCVHVSNTYNCSKQSKLQTMNVHHFYCFLTYLKLANQWSKNDITTVFAKIDIDHDGYINVSDFVNTVINSLNQPSNINQNPKLTQFIQQCLIKWVIDTMAYICLVDPVNSFSSSTLSSDAKQYLQQKHSNFKQVGYNRQCLKLVYLTMYLSDQLWIEILLDLVNDDRVDTLLLYKHKKHSSTTSPNDNKFLLTTLAEKIIKCNFRDNMGRCAIINLILSNKYSEQRKRMILDRFRRLSARFTVCDKFERTPFWYICEQGYMILCDYFIQYNWITDKVDACGKSALFIALEKGNSSLVHRLLHDQPTENINSRARQLTMKNKYKYSLTITDEKGNSMLHCAAKHGFCDIAGLLCQCEPYLINHENTVQRSALSEACFHGYFEFVRLMINFGAKITCDKYGKTPLDIATQRYKFCDEARKSNFEKIVHFLRTHEMTKLHVNVRNSTLL